MHLGNQRVGADAGKREHFLGNGTGKNVLVPTCGSVDVTVFPDKQSLPLTCGPHFLSLVPLLPVQRKRDCKDPKSSDAAFQIWLSPLGRECTGHVVGKETFQNCHFGYFKAAVRVALDRSALRQMPCAESTRNNAVLWTHRPCKQLI